MKYIQLFLNFNCNQNCNFCFIKGIAKNTVMSLPHFKTLASILRNKGIREIDILGGEPFLHPEIIPILEIASDNFDSIFISTNGTAIDLMMKAKKLFPNLKIGISLNSEPAEDLKKFIIKYRPFLKSVVNRRYFLSSQAVDFIKRGIPYYIIFRDTLHRNELKEAMSFYEFLTKVRQWRQTYPSLRPVYCSGFISDSDSKWRCPAGSTKLSIMPEGSVFPCYLFFKFSEFRLGNIFETELEGILTHPVFDFFRHSKINNCTVKDCPIRSKCHGGCPAVSYAIYGDLNLPDPRCLESDRNN